MPLGMSPIQCARRGWTNVGPETLECQCCGERIAVSARPEATSAGGLGASAPSAAPRPWEVNGEVVRLEKGDVEAWASLLVERHSPFCPWRCHEASCADPMKQLDSEIVAGVERRLAGLRAGLLHRPVLTDDPDHGDSGDSATPGLGGAPGGERPPHISALELLARAGWEHGGRGADGEDVLQCTFCLRAVISQSFRHVPLTPCVLGSKRSQPEGGFASLAEESASKAPRSEGVSAPSRDLWTWRGARPQDFDAHAMHRFYCPMFSRPDDELGPAAVRLARCRLGRSPGAEALAAEGGEGSDDGAAAAAPSDAGPGGASLATGKPDEAVERAYDLLRQLDAVLDQ